jgi:hypothetical protein
MATPYVRYVTEVWGEGIELSERVSLFPEQWKRFLKSIMTCVVSLFSYYREFEDWPSTE